MSELSRILSLVLLLVFAACSDDNLTASNDTLPLDMDWKLVSAGPPGMNQPVDGTYTLRFSRDLTIHGNDACNVCTGTYSPGARSRIAIFPTCTEKACTPSPSFGYAEALGHVTSFYNDRDRLVLVYQTASGDTWEMVHVQNE